MATNKYNKLAGKIVLVIGGSAGIGRGVAEAALAAGANVVISSSSQPRLDKAAAELQADCAPGQKAVGIAADLSNSTTVEADVDALFAAAHDRLGAPTNHVVYTAADHLRLGGLEDVTPDLVLAAAHMRCVVPLVLGKVAARHLPKSYESSLTVTTGTIAEKPAKGWAVIAFMGGGLQTLARALALELAPIRVNAVRPGFVDTGLWDGMGKEGKEGLIRTMEETMLTGRAGRVEDVAEAYLWLMKDGNATGTVAGSDSGTLCV